MATKPPLSPPVNETEHSVSRITREGKKLTYNLRVMQQPERARACGAGAKSSADRRPVDPPPVVELRIFESDPGDDSNLTEITFAYNANFFLYATLDTARPIAQGRLASTPTFPVLTGVPVAGVAYLDRPFPAGYFIFPDLSVRHEGLYRLNFHLYEETKESKDADEGTAIQSPMHRTNLSKPTIPKSFLEFRLEVVSIPFTVYSAKKFPGLTQSTHLSRIIAEQGCRVRIRRDVRMRRRGEKRSDDYDYEEDRMLSSRLERHSTADTCPNPAERPRSTSIGTVDHCSGPEASRRASATEYGFQNVLPYQRPVPHAPAPPAASIPSPIASAAPSSHNASYQSHLSFGSTQTQYSAPQLPRLPPSGSTSIAAFPPHATHSHSRNSSASSEHSDPKPFRLPPMRVNPPTPNPSPTDLRSSDPPMYPTAAQPAAAMPQPRNNILPPISSLSSEFPIDIPQPRNTAALTPGPEANQGRRLYYDTNSGTTFTKRTHEESFGIAERPLYNGMRPNSDTYSQGDRRLSDASREASYSPSRNELAYKRANGRMVTKISPAMR
ncbi:sexual development activator VeA [Aspergillus saccharolyticus JOP 1030-1]|uniref:Developmental and secondary metabolism regulator veA n=1 Tax=Aspergillus saccharolyticus JOP 1030-1 TaxID=1450539 RepID=A0A318ZVT5_9EURO|nr:hypothetical protein BP01DRAFT_148919 [Aspergillus saccharolyticus JOP 1030-1]PYH48473.1 hypothetical protein BP01DRAFT_148919 [Aspergillus saccharolyticus JOP 1030-1]